MSTDHPVGAIHESPLHPDQPVRAIHESPQLEHLLQCVEQVTTSWQWYPATDYGSTEALCPTAPLIALEQALEDYDALSEQSKI